MATEVYMPRLTHDMQEGVLLNWLKEEGDQVQAGDPLFEVETDKAVTEVEADASGVLRGLRFKAGDEIPIGSTMAYILQKGEELPEQPVQQAPAASFQHEAAEPRDRAAEKARAPSGASDARRPRIIASPIAKRIAREHDIDVSQLSGSGPRGRIVEADVRAFMEAQTESRAVGPGWAPAYEKIPLTRIQKTTGERMARSFQTAPQFTLEVDVNMKETVRWREAYQRVDGEKVSYTSILVYVAARALRRHPRVNVSFHGDHLRQYHDVNIGVAMASPDGLMVPVLHNVDRLSLDDIHARIKELQNQASNNRLPVEALRAGTFTVTNLGMYGIDRFQAIINPPEAAILAAGRITEWPWVDNDGREMRPLLTLRLSVDHRALDGAAAAPFLTGIRALLENPYLNL